MKPMITAATTTRAPTMTSMVRPAGCNESEDCSVFADRRAARSGGLLKAVFFIFFRATSRHRRQDALGLPHCLARLHGSHRICASRAGPDREGEHARIAAQERRRRAFHNVFVTRE